MSANFLNSIGLPRFATLSQSYNESEYDDIEVIVLQIGFDMNNTPIAFYIDSSGAGGINTTHLSNIYLSSIQHDSGPNDFDKIENGVAS